MEFYVPSIGDELWLSRDWKFTLYKETRNQKFFHEHLELVEPYEGRFIDLDDDHPAVILRNTYTAYGAVITLPTGTQLVVDRIYIRKGKSQYDSITFKLKDHPKGLEGRFWVKLEDANTIACKLTPVNPQAGNPNRFEGIEL